MSKRSIRQFALLLLIVTSVGVHALNQRNSTASSAIARRPEMQSNNANQGEIDVEDPLVPPLKLDVDFLSSDSRAHFHPHGDEVCASGCAVSRHPTKALSVKEFNRLAAAYQMDGVSEDTTSSLAFDSLLYYGRQTTRMLDRFPGAIAGAHLRRLRTELRITHARISIRVIDENGTVRSWIPPTRVPFDRRHVFDMETTKLPPHVASGTIKRVGLNRLWTRL